MPQFHDDEEVPLPRDSGSSNIMLRIKQAMRACGIVMSDARWTYVRLYCALCALRGQQHRSKVTFAMCIIIRDEMFLQPHQTCTVRLGYEITKLRQRLAQLDHRPYPYVQQAAPALGQ